jgi:hypothetical protein
MMISAWWLVAALLLGGSGGFMVFALLAVSSRAHERATAAEESVAREGLARVGLEPSWTAK